MNLLVLVGVACLSISIILAVQTLAKGNDEVSGRIEQAVEVAGRAYGVEPELIKAVIKAESSFRTEAVSARGAQGLMQLMPNTAKELGVKDPFNSEQNIFGGTHYLRMMYDRFGTWRLALIAYNWGPGNLTWYGADAMPPETRNYLLRVERFYGKDLDSQ